MKQFGGFNNGRAKHKRFKTVFFEEIFFSLCKDTKYVWAAYSIEFKYKKSNAKLRSLAPRKTKPSPEVYTLSGEPVLPISSQVTVTV